jgi:hypothetical protein
MLTGSHVGLEELPCRVCGLWQQLQDDIEVELTSEDAESPIEGALLAEGSGGWRAREHIYVALVDTTYYRGALRLARGSKEHWCSRPAPFT